MKWCVWCVVEHAVDLGVEKKLEVLSGRDTSSYRLPFVPPNVMPVVVSG